MKQRDREPYILARLRTWRGFLNTRRKQRDREPYILARHLSFAVGADTPKAKGS